MDGINAGSGAVPAAQKPQRKKRYKNRNWAWGLGMVAPTIIGLIILNIYPFFYTIYLSTMKFQGLGKPKYIGFQNFSKMLSDAMTWNALRNTLLFVLFTVPVGVFLSLIFAALLNSKIRGRDTYRAIYFLPMVVAPAAVAMVWKWILNSDIGILNQFLGLFGIQGPTWISDPKTALISCAIINIWSAIGYDLVLILAGLQSISKTYYEAAEIDGASPVQSFFHITVPLLRPIILLTIITTTNGTLQILDEIYQLTGGGPANSTISISQYIYSTAFAGKPQFPYASAMSFVLFVAIALLTALQMKVGDENE